MKSKRIGILTAMIVIATAAGVGIFGCSDDRSPTVAPDRGSVDRTKAQQRLSGAPDWTLTGEAGVTFAIHSNGSVDFLGMTAAAGGIYTFSESISRFQTSINSSFPAGGGTLQYRGMDNVGNMVAQIDMQPGIRVGSYDAFPTFISMPHSTPGYDATIYDINGNQVGGQFGIQAGNPVIINPGVGCPITVTQVIWRPDQFTNQAIWELVLDPNCNSSIRLPNGTSVNGCRIRFVEHNSTGVYIFAFVASMAVRGSVASYTAQSVSVN